MTDICATAKVIASVIDGASERAVLVANDGVVLHRNGPAARFLVQAPSSSHILLITDMLVVENGKDWKSLDHCRLVKVDGKATRSERNLHWVVTESCPCCDRTYYTCYICSKHERVREVVDHAFDPVLTANEEGIIVTVNEAACELFGYQEGELVGHNLKMICGGGHAENHDQYLKNYKETGVKKIIGTKREVLGRKKNGPEFPCELGIQEIVDVSTQQRFFCGFFKDLTLLKQHQAEIQERQARMQGMINASFDSMFEIDQNGIIQIVNDAACSMFGYTRGEFLGSNISMICGDGHAEHHASYMKRYMDGGERRIIGQKRQVKARRKNGMEIVVELGVQEVVLENGKKAFCGFIRDMTAHKKDKRALRMQEQLIQEKFFEKLPEDDAK